VFVGESRRRTVDDEVSLEQVYARARAIYPVWSISLNDKEFPDDARR
jgi:hypothetical protein